MTAGSDEHRTCRGAGRDLAASARDGGAHLFVVIAVVSGIAISATGVRAQGGVVASAAPSTDAVLAPTPAEDAEPGRDAGTGEPAIPPEAIAEIRGGALGRLGLVAGVAAVAPIAVGIDDVWFSPSPAAMPYVGVLPFLLAVHGAESREYCTVDLWGAGAGASAQEAANAAAARRAARQLGRALSTDAAVRHQETLDQTGWDTDDPARCSFLARLGIYVGVPIEYSTSLTFERVTRTRTVTPMVSAGLVLIAPPYVTFHLGFALVAFDDNAPEPDRRYTGALIVGLGSSLDLFDFLLNL